ncbi:MAG: hypothetical protein HRT36_08545 [Alphaproteobacteria bacterium]|nr:hypothetical protein [Alphaproteobacteria bacterium]
MIDTIREQETGLPTAVVCRKHGIGPSSFYKAESQGIEDFRAASNLWKMKTPNSSACWRRRCWTMPF